MSNNKFILNLKRELGFFFSFHVQKRNYSYCLSLIIIIIIIIIVRTSFDLDPTQEWIQAHVAQTMNL